MQFVGIPKRKQSKNTSRTVQYSNLSNLSLKEQPQKQNASRPRTAPALKEWNSDTQTPGLFNIKISKKVPIEVQTYYKECRKDF